MLTADESVPTLHNQPFEGIMQESELAARKDTKQVAIKISEDGSKVEIARIIRRRRDYPQTFAQRRRPVSQQHDGGAVDLDRGRKIRARKRLLLPESFLYGTEEQYQLQ